MAVFNYHSDGTKSAAQIKKIVRQRRLTAAKAKGRHTKQEWLDMKAFFEHTCVRCFGASKCPHLEKDHIVPISIEGSDGLDNLQPLCATCNCSKVNDTTDWRPQAAARLGKVLPDQYRAKQPSLQNI
jgi:5-methylcytosine-specific restriction endonuclease McrA